MSTKPTDAGRFAVDGSDVDATNISAPSSGRRDTGYTLDYVPPSAEANYLENLSYRWRKYLSDGALSGNHSIAGTLTVGGTFAVSEGALSFVDFTFTADNTVDTIIHTAHGLQSGDGPVRTSNSGGALPGGLAAATDYWFIRIDANTGKLATSRANALVGTTINLTTDGTGTQTLQHQTGTTRANDASISRNLTVDGLITVAVNQDMQVSGTGGYKHGDVVLPIYPTFADGTTPSLNASHNFVSASGSGTFLYEIPALIGRRIKSLVFYVAGDGTTDWFWEVFKYDYTSATRTTLDSGSLSNIGGGPTSAPTSWTATNSNPTDTTIATAQRFCLEVAVSSGVGVLGIANVTYDYV